METPDINKIIKFAEQHEKIKEYYRNYSNQRYYQMKEDEQKYKEYLEKLKPKNNERSKINFQKIKENKELYEVYKAKQNERRRKK
jgi:hypothetical protein